MPSSSPKQARLMAAAAHNPQFAKKVGVPVKVAKEFNKADTGGKMLSAPHSSPTAHRTGSGMMHAAIQAPGPMTSWTGVSGVGDQKLKTGYKKV